MSLIINLFVGGIYQIQKLGQITITNANTNANTTTDTIINTDKKKEIYQNQILLEMIKIISINTILTGLVELIFNSSKSSVKTFFLIILLNFILFYIYSCLIKINISDSEKLYYDEKIEIFNCVMTQPIKLSKSLSHFLMKLSNANN
jgi:hypothetical protein